MAPTLAQSPARRSPRSTSRTILTDADAKIGTSPKDVVWTHRNDDALPLPLQPALPVPVLLVFALINRPDIFDLRPGNSFVEFLLDEGYDVFLVDWGAPDERTTTSAWTTYVCDALPWAMRETLRASGQEELSLVGWCIGGALSLHARLDRPGQPGRNLAPAHDARRHERLALLQVDRATVRRRLRRRHATGSSPARASTVTNKMMKPVTNFWTTYRTPGARSWRATARREAYQTMAKWVADNPPFAGRAYREWIDGDVPAQPARRGHACACAASGSTCATSSRTCWS